MAGPRRSSFHSPGAGDVSRGWHGVRGCAQSGARACRKVGRRMVVWSSGVRLCVLDAVVSRRAGGGGGWGGGGGGWRGLWAGWGGGGGLGPWWVAFVSLWSVVAGARGTLGRAGCVARVARGACRVRRGRRYEPFPVGESISAMGCVLRARAGRGATTTGWVSQAWRSGGRGAVRSGPSGPGAPGVVRSGPC